MLMETDSDHCTRPITSLIRACLQGERVTIARVTIASDGVKIALVYKQKAQVGLPYHPGLALRTCFVMHDILCNVKDLK